MGRVGGVSVGRVCCGRAAPRATAVLASRSGDWRRPPSWLTQGRSRPPGSVRHFRLGPRACRVASDVARRAGRPFSSGALCPRSTVRRTGYPLRGRDASSVFPVYRHRRGTQRLRAGRPAGPKEPEQGRAETASYRGGTSRGDSSAPFPLPVSYEAITRRLNSCYNGLRQWYRSPIANLNRAPQKARSARPPHFRSKDARGLQRRRLYAYKPRRRRVGQPAPARGGAVQKLDTKVAHRAPTPQKHTSKHPYATYRAASQGGGPTGGRGGPGAAKFRLLGGGGTPPRFGSSCW